MARLPRPWAPVPEARVAGPRCSTARSCRSGSWGSTRTVARQARLTI